MSTACFDPGYIVLPHYLRFSFKHDSVPVSIVLTMSLSGVLYIFKTRNISLTVQMGKEGSNDSSILFIYYNHPLIS